MRGHVASVSRLEVGMHTDSADVVIVGSGMGGGTLGQGIYGRWATSVFSGSAAPWM
ncbi:MAG: hypothetical protein O2943_09930 [Actinomycetota bacterium]|nr:hypothetical protein [Actinomycetota bacterium]